MAGGSRGTRLSFRCRLEMIKRDHVAELLQQRRGFRHAAVDVRLGIIEGVRR